jgi:hypothetical protein
MNSKSRDPDAQSDAEQELPILITPTDLPAQEQIPENELSPPIPTKVTQRKIQRALEAQLDPDLDTIVQILVSFRNDTTPSADQARHTSGEAAARVAYIGDPENPEYRELTARLRDEWGIEVIENFAPLRTLLVRMPSNRVREFARQDIVRYAELRYAGEKPPNGPVIKTGADRIRIPPAYRSLVDGRIALLDSGVNYDRVVNGRLARVKGNFDCVNANPNQPCISLNAEGDNCCDEYEHGTLVAATLTADSSLADFQGITSIPVDSYRVYGPDPTGEAPTCILDNAAAVRAFNDIVKAHKAGHVYTMIAALMQGERDDPSGLVAAAENAVVAGISVVAPTGNPNPEDNQVLVPALARTVIGAGAVDATDPGGPFTGLQRVGPTDDGRIKPDVQGPTGYYALENYPHDFGLGETSGATPFVAGAGALFAAWLRQNRPDLAVPGVVYALLILSGGFAAVDDQRGTGLLSLPGRGTLWVGKINALRNGYAQRINLTTNNSGVGPANAGPLDAAIWWPESAAIGHRHICLELVPPQGGAGQSSCNEHSVFQRIRAQKAAGTAPWQLRISWVDALATASSQVVYWAAYLRS